MTPIQQMMARYTSILEEREPISYRYRGKKITIRMDARGGQPSQPTAYVGVMSIRRTGDLMSEQPYRDFADAIEAAESFVDGFEARERFKAEMEQSNPTEFCGHCGNGKRCDCGVENA